MPIDRSKFRRGKIDSRLGDEIVCFLKERKKRALSSREIMGALHFHTDFSTPETAKISTFAIADFTAMLHDLASKRKLKRKVVGERVYFMASLYSGKCPKCGIQVNEPKKTWKMAGRPDRKGKRLQLHIGLFYCPKHGAFRIALEKRKI